MVRSHRVKVLIPPIIRHCIGVFTLARHFVSHVLRNLESHAFHHLPTIQTAYACFEQLLHSPAKLPLLSINQLAAALAPVVVSRLADLHHPAHNGEGVPGRFGFDEAKPYFISFAKKADAFF
jgi:hypothetical protein